MAFLMMFSAYGISIVIDAFCGGEFNHINQPYGG